MKNQVQLITYPDSLGGNLDVLSNILRNDFPDTFGGLHILPPFPSTGDRGFAPTTYREIETRFGSWEDIKQLCRTYEVMLDFMVNHISKHSLYFQDLQRYGRSSKYADLFLTLDKVWPGGKIIEADVEKIFLRRPVHPFLDVSIETDGSVERIWATFGGPHDSDQIDIDVRSGIGQRFIQDTLNFLAGRGVRSIRLDAVAFVIKRSGTSCFFVEPEICEFLTWVHEHARQLGIELLLEIHIQQEIQSRLEQYGYRIYNFVLPLLVLHTLMNGSSAALKAHLKNSPRRQVTTLDSHDGIPVQPDIQGVLDVDSARRVVRICEERGANISRIYSSEHQGEAGFDAHQINCTYYSALNRDDDAYILSRALQFFTPGIPQVYYVGLLAGENTPEEIEKQADRRAINRYNYSRIEVKKALGNPVVQRLLKLIRFRNEEPCFNGTFEIHECSDEEVLLTWTLERRKVTLNANTVSRMCKITILDAYGKVVEYYP